MRRVLVVDDEPHIRKVLRGCLEADGFKVAEAADGVAALTALRGEPPDLVLLDVMLPGIDGLEVLRQLRGFSDTYVIPVTAKAEEVDKLVGLGVGADDCLTKPFSPREVTARVKAVLRRGRGTQADQDAPLHFDGLSIAPGGRDVTVEGQQVALSSLEFDLLAALAGSRAWSSHAPSCCSGSHPRTPRLDRHRRPVRDRAAGRQREGKLGQARSAHGDTYVP